MTTFIGILSTIFTWIGWFIFAYMVVVVLLYFIVFLLSFLELKKSKDVIPSLKEEEIFSSIDTKPVSILVPAYNEELGVVPSVKALLSMEYPEFEIIVINDGSKDKTLEKMIEQFQMKRTPQVIRSVIPTKKVKTVYQSTVHSNLYLIDKENGGKADALNTGINLSHYPYVCSIDGDSVLERNAFLKVMKPIIDSDGDVIAVGGSVRIANGCKIERGELVEVGLSRHPVVIMQVIEYLRAFLIGRIGLSRLNILLIVSGAFGVFHKESVLKVGGYRTDTVGEDMELVVRLHRLIKDEGKDQRIVYVPDPVCWTEAPESLKVLRRQRSRWHRGLFETLRIHKSMLFNPKYKNVGTLSMPYFLFVELLGVVVEVVGYALIVLGLLFSFIDPLVSTLLLCMSILLGSLLSMAAVLLEEWSLKKYPKVSDLVKLFLYALFETFWYRPIMTFYRFTGLIQVFKKNHSWGEMTRKGVSS